MQALLLRDGPGDEDLLGLGASAASGQPLELSPPDRGGSNRDAAPDRVEPRREFLEHESGLERRRLPDRIDACLPSGGFGVDRRVPFGSRKTAPAGADGPLRASRRLPSLP